jgi:polyhydroxyalkanoate synthesis regulator phasin
MQSGLLEPPTAPEGTIVETIERPRFTQGIDELGDAVALTPMKTGLIRPARQEKMMAAHDRFENMDLAQIAEHREKNIGAEKKLVRGFQLAVDADAKQLDESAATLETMKAQVDAAPTPDGVAAYNAAVNRHNSDVTSLRKQQKALEDASTSLQVDQDELARREYNIKSKNGSFIGATQNEFLAGAGEVLGGFETLIAFGLLSNMPVGSEVVLGERPGSRDEILKKVRKYAISPLADAPVEALGSKGTTPEYVDEMKKGFLGGAWLGLARSAPGMATPYMSGIGLQMLQSSMEEMDAPESKDVSEAEKFAVSVPIAAVSAALERFGFKNLASNKAIVKTILGSGLRKLSAEAGVEEVSRVMNMEARNFASRYTAAAATGAAAEFETGAMQEAATSGMQDIYNHFKGVDENGKERFKTPDGWMGYLTESIKAGAQEAVGGFIMAQPYAVSQAIRKNAVGTTATPKQFEMVEELAVDHNYDATFKQKLEQDVEDAKVTPEQAKQVTDDWETAKRIIQKTPDDLPVGSRMKAFDILSQMEGLRKKEPALVANKMEALKQQLQDLEGVPETPEATVDAEGKKGEEPPPVQPTGEEVQQQSLISAEGAPADGGIDERRMARALTPVKAWTQDLPDVENRWANEEERKAEALEDIRFLSDRIEFYVDRAPNMSSEQVSERVWNDLRRHRAGTGGAPAMVNSGVNFQDAVVRLIQAKKDGKNVGTLVDYAIDRRGLKTPEPAVQTTQQPTVVEDATRTDGPNVDTAGAGGQVLQGSDTAVPEGRSADALSPPPVPPQAPPSVPVQERPVSDLYVKPDLSRDVADDPVALAGAYADEHMAQNDGSSLDDQIGTLVSNNISADSFKMFGDVNKITKDMKRAYLRESGGRTLDDLAQELSGEGNEVSPQDIVEYVLRNPAGRSATTPRSREIADRYYGITGKRMNSLVAKSILKGKNVKWKPEEQAIVDEAQAAGVDLSEINDDDVNEFKDMSDEDADLFFGSPEVKKTVAQRKLDADASRTKAEEQVQRERAAPAAREVRGAESAPAPQREDPEADRLQVELDAARADRDKFVADWNDRGQGLFPPEVGQAQQTIDGGFDNSQENFDAKDEVLRQRVLKAQDALVAHVDKQIDRAAAAAKQTSIPEATATPADKAIGAASRTRPRQAIVFDNPIVGPSGVALHGYEWQYTFEEYVDKRGEDGVRRVSDWDKAELSDETGRDIVHQFIVVDKSGNSSLMSAESVLKAMGYLDNGGKDAKGKMSAAKTLARMLMERQALQEELAREKDARAKVSKMQKPSVDKQVKEDGNEDLRGGARERSKENVNEVWRMGDAEVWVMYDEKSSLGWDDAQERLKTLEFAWETNRLKELGVNPYSRITSRLRDVEKKIAVKERQLGATVSQQASIEAASIADRIRSLKINTKGTAGSFIIPPQVFNAAIELVAKAVEAGEVLAKAIKAGIAHIKESDWYKGLSEEEQKQATAEFEATINGGKKPSNTPVKKITVNEMSALKDQIRLEARAAREAKGDVRTKQKAFAESVKTMLKGLEGSLTEARSRSLITAAVSVDPSNPLQVERFIASLETAIARSAESGYMKELQKAIDLANPANYKTRRPSGVVVGKIEADKMKMLERIHGLIKAGNLDDIFERIAGIDDSLIDGSMPVEEVENELEALRIAAGALSGEIDGAKAAQEAIKQIVAEGRSSLREVLKDKAQMYAKMKANAVQAVTGGKGVKSQFERAAIEKEAEGFLRSVVGNIHQFLDSAEGLRTLLDKMDIGKRQKDNPYGSTLDRSIYEPISDALNSDSKLNRDAIDMLHAKLVELYGSKRNVVKAQRKNTHQEDVGTFTNLNGDKVDVRLSQNQAYYLYNLAKNPDNIETFRAMGWTDEMMDAITNFLDPKVREWADWQTEKFYPEMYKKVNRVYKRMNYLDLPQVEQYTPIRREGKKSQPGEATVNLENGAKSVQAAFGITPGALKERVGSTAPFDITIDGDALLLQHMSKMNHYVAYAEAIKGIAAIVGDSQFREGVRQNNNKGTLSALDGFVKDIAQQGVNRDKAFSAIEKLNGRMATSTLAISPVLTLKQMTAFPAYMSEMPIKDFVRGVGEFALNPMQAHRDLMESEYLKERFRKGFDRDVAIAMAKDYKKTFSKKGTIMEKLMWNVKYGDMGAILMGGYANYKYHYRQAKKQGFSEAGAKQYAIRRFEEATKLSQQSTGIPDLSHFQRGNGLAKMATLYMTQPMSYFRQERKAFRDMYRGIKSKDPVRIADATKRFIIYHVFLPALFQYVSNGLPGLIADWDDDDEEDMIRAMALGSLNGVFLIGNTFAYMADRLQKKPWANDGPDYIPAFKPVSELARAVVDVVDKWLIDENAQDEDVMEALSDLSFASVDFAGYPASRVQKLYGNYEKVVQQWNELTPQQIALLMAGYNEYTAGTREKKEKSTSSRRPSRPGRPSR